MQRRHQKVVETAPAMLLKPETRQVRSRLCFLFLLSSVEVCFLFEFYGCALMLLFGAHAILCMPVLSGDNVEAGALHGSLNFFLQAPGFLVRYRIQPGKCRVSLVPALSREV